MTTVPLHKAFDLSTGFTLVLGRESSRGRPQKSRRLRAMVWRLFHSKPQEPSEPAPLRSFPVPPLTLGRFLDLMSSDWQALAHGLLASDLVGAGSAQLAEFLGRQLAGIDHRAFGQLVVAVVPGLTREEWDADGDVVSAFRLFNYIANVHDWKLIGRAIGWGDEDEETPSRATVAHALVRMSSTTGYTVESLLSTRIEGFFYLRDGLFAPEPEAEDGNILSPGASIADGAGLISDPEKRSPLWGAIDEADKVVQ